MGNRSGTTLRQELVILNRALAICMTLHFDISIGIFFQNICYFIQVSHGACSQVRVVKIEEYFISEFNYNTFAYPLYFSIGVGCLYFFSLLVHLPTNDGARNATYRCTYDGTEG